MNKINTTTRWVKRIQATTVAPVLFIVVQYGTFPLQGREVQITREDTGFAVSPLFSIQLDFGDAPQPYRTLLAANGARHLIDISGPRLGSLIDPETDGQPDALAQGDDEVMLDDEDGVAIPILWRQDSQVTLTITVNQSCRLDAWIDWGCDGAWSGGVADIFDAVAIGHPLAAGANDLILYVPPAPVSATGVTYARFRVSNGGGLGTGGFSPDGEVEDYPLMISASTHVFKPAVELSRSAGEGTIRWQGNAAWCSQFEQSVDLKNWHQIGMPVREAEDVNEFAIAPRFLAAEKRFFRLVREPLVTSPIPMPSPGAEAAHQFLYQTFVHDGITRHYRLKLPNSWTSARSWPFVLVLPGHGQSVADFWQLHSEFMALANGDDGDADPNDGWIMCFAEATTGEGSYSWYCYDDPNLDNPVPPSPWVDDYGFVKSLCNAFVASGLNIDPQRMYATGFSNGANFTHFIASKPDHPFAAFAAVEGSVFYARAAADGSTIIVDTPLPALPRPVLIENQIDSATWPYEGRLDQNYNFGAPSISVENCAACWASANGVPEAAADPVNHVYTLPDPLPSDVWFFSWTANAGPVMRVRLESIRPDEGWPQGLLDQHNGWDAASLVGLPLTIQPRVPAFLRALYPHVIAPDTTAPTTRAVVVNGTWSRQIWRPVAPADPANEVQLVTMSTGGHNWPAEDSPWDGHVEVLKFFEAH